MKGPFKLVSLIGAALLFSGICHAQNDTRQLLPLEDTTTLASEEFPEFDPAIAAESGYSVEEDEAGSYKVRTPVSLLWDSIKDLLVHFLFNLLISWIIVQFFYYRKGGRKQYYFTFLIFSSAMFLLLFVMNNLSLQIGFTLGLFAIFGMIRYRTETVPVREMTYLFIIIALSIINGVGAEVPFVEIVVANIALLLLIWTLESVGGIGKRTSAKIILYDRIELIMPEKRAELMTDLQARTGLDIEDIEVGSIDFLKDSAYLKVTYRLAKNENNSIDNAIRIKSYED